MPGADQMAPQTAGAAVTPAGPVDLSQKMLIVDVVIVSSEEDITTSKGVNLLNGLQILFGQGITASSPTGAAFTTVLSNATSPTHLITRAITIPAIAYSLNIANSGTNRSEILARPSLVATSGIKSEFFSGSNIRAAAVAATTTGAPTGSIDVDKDIGVKLGVTPQFLGNDKVRLQVQAERTFLQNTTGSVQFQFQINTTKTTVNANVVMNLGETLILSGLSEKELDNVRSGVPGLQDVPIVQYFFSTQTTRDFNKSILILLTPRASEYVYRPRDVRERAQAAMSPDERVLSELQSRYTDWFRPYPNWASVFHHLQENQLYREFRTGDVTLERWESQTKLGVRLSKLPDFLYY
jgi:type II secretory pathway component GspD/PulD (secretin)